MMMLRMTILRNKYRFGKGNDMLQIKRRLEALERSQEASVDSALDEFQLFIKSPMFNKEKAWDYLTNKKIVAMETNHSKSGPGVMLVVAEPQLDALPVARLGITRTTALIS